MGGGNAFGARKCVQADSSSRISIVGRNQRIAKPEVGSGSSFFCRQYEDANRSRLELGSIFRRGFSVEHRAHEAKKAHPLLWFARTWIGFLQGVGYDPRRRAVQGVLVLRTVFLYDLHQLLH